jgi:Arc/MetJ family transcription regulator
MGTALTSMRLDGNLADEAAEALGVKTRTEAIHIALKQVIELKEFKKLMAENGGKLKFEGYDE